MRNFRLIGITALCLFFNSTVEAQSIKVGFIASLSGSAQIYGEAAKNGFELALQEFNDGLIQPIYEDDKFQPVLTAAAFKKLIEIDKVDVVVSVGSTPSNAIAPLAQIQKVPLLAWASDRKVSSNRTYVIRTYPSGDDEGRSIAQFAIKEGLKKFAIAISNNDYAQSWLGGIKSIVEPINITNEEVTTGDLTDYKPLLLKIRKHSPQVLAICLDPGKSGVMAKQSREIGMQTQIIGCEYLHDQQELAISQNTLLGSFFPTVVVQAEFQKKYMKKFGNDSIISGAAVHYDVAQILHTIAKSGSKEPLIDQILKVGKRNGAVGPFELKNNSDDRYFEIPLQVLEVTSSGFRAVS